MKRWVQLKSTTAHTVGVSTLIAAESILRLYFQPVAFIIQKQGGIYAPLPYEGEWPPARRKAKARHAERTDIVPSVSSENPMRYAKEIAMQINSWFIWLYSVQTHNWARETRDQNIEIRRNLPDAVVYRKDATKANKDATMQSELGLLVR